MSYTEQDPELSSSLHPSRHAPKPSLDTNASGLAESATSAISFSAFPPPPSSIPSPRHTASPSLSSSTKSNLAPVRPLVPRRGFNLPARTAAGSPATSNTHLREGSFRPQATEQLASTSRAPPSAHAWNDAASGISGISVDATEDRLLPTSFITSLLQENKDLRRARHNSTASDALSGISEMTYPPPDDSLRQHHRGLPSRLGAPPSSFAPIPEGPVHRMSSDSETLHSMQGFAGKQQGARNPAGQRSPSNVLTSVSGHQKDGQFDEDHDGDSIMRYKAIFQPPPYAGTEPQSRIPRNNIQPNHAARQSIHSVKSVAPSFISRMSIPRPVRRILNWGKSMKPLPPVPLIPDISLAAEAQYRRADEAAPLPDLVNRAGQLHGILEKEYYQQDSMGYDHIGSKSDTSTDQTSSQSRIPRSDSWQPLRRRDVDQFGAANPVFTFGDPPAANERQHGFPFCVPQLSRRVGIAIAVIGTVIVVVVIAVAVVVSKKADRFSTCTSGLTGSLCNLNATCVCTSSSSSLCNGLAQNIIDLIPVVNQQFSGNFSNIDVYNSLWLAQGITGRNDCSSQSLLVDTGKSLDMTSHPNRTHWAQAAMLWNIVQSQDINAASAMRKFVQTAQWKEIGPADGPTNSNAALFTATFAGYIYNFASQTVSQPLATFVKQGQPLSAQIARVGAKAQAALDRMYTFALASSTQQEVALQNYWTTTLSQNGNDLATFKGLLSRSPIYIPFNGSSSGIQSLYNSSSMLFPPPLACYPALSSQLLGEIKTFETSVFNLDSPAPASSFNATCYPDRPIYGVLDLLHLRLPYTDNRPWLPRQAAILMTGALPRVVVYANEMLSATFPGVTPRANFTQSDLDPRRFGTLNLPNHVVLQYLSSMPVNVASALARFVLSTATNPAVPPDPSSVLFQTLSSIPVLEVAIFGNIGPSDLSGTVSSFTTPTGAFFFGSDPGSALRNWTISTAGGSVVWTENSTSPRIVRDNSLTDATVNQAWAAVESNGPNVGLSNLTNAFQATQKFSAT